MKYVFSLIIALFLSLSLGISVVQAEEETSVIGVHILNTSELNEAKELIKVEHTDTWQYVTIPFTLADLDKKTEWQEFFATAQKNKIIPLVRLATAFEAGSWQVPTRKDVTEQLQFLSELEWPTAKRHIIVFNEVNHAKEWGGCINPQEYADILRFTSEWAHTEHKNYVVLPAALDLAAPNGTQTKEAFAYLEELLTADTEILSYLDGWNSHSYPNPGFSASPLRTGKNSLRGYQYELAFLEKHGYTNVPVYITETGWEETRYTRQALTSYYEYALKYVWSDPRIKAVTPFVLKGAPGPFAGFSFVDSNGAPTRQYQALRAALERIKKS